MTGGTFVKPGKDGTRLGKERGGNPLEHAAPKTGQVKSSSSVAGWNYRSTLQLSLACGRVGEGQLSKYVPEKKSIKIYQLIDLILIPSRMFSFKRLVWKTFGKHSLTHSSVNCFLSEHKSAIRLEKVGEKVRYIFVKKVLKSLDWFFGASFIWPSVSELSNKSPDP